MASAHGSAHSRVFGKEILPSNGQRNDHGSSNDEFKCLAPCNRTGPNKEPCFKAGDYSDENSYSLPAGGKPPPSNRKTTAQVPSADLQAFVEKLVEHELKNPKKAFILQRKVWEAQVHRLKEQQDRLEEQVEHRCNLYKQREVEALSKAAEVEHRCNLYKHGEEEALSKAAEEVQKALEKAADSHKAEMEATTAKIAQQALNLEFDLARATDSECRAREAEGKASVQEQELVRLRAEVVDLQHEVEATKGVLQTAEATKDELRGAMDAQGLYVGRLEEECQVRVRKAEEDEEQLRKFKDTIKDHDGTIKQLKEICRMQDEQIRQCTEALSVSHSSTRTSRDQPDDPSRNTRNVVDVDLADGPPIMTREDGSMTPIPEENMGAMVATGR